MALPPAAALAVAGALALADWHGAFHGRARLDRAARPLVTLALLTWAITLGAVHSSAGWCLLFAVALAVVADALGFVPGTGPYVTTVVARLVSLVGLAVAVGMSGPTSTPAMWVAAVLAAAGLLTAGRRVIWAAIDEGGAGLGAAIGLFSVVLGAVPVLAAGSLDPRLVVGSWLLVVAFLVAGAHRFLGGRPRAPFVTAVAEQVGMALIVAGVLR